MDLEVLCVFSTKGVPQPFRLRMKTEDESLLVVPIKKILYMEENKRDDIFKFRCQCIIQDRNRYVDLYYNKKIMKWSLDLKQGM